MRFETEILEKPKVSIQEETLQEIILYNDDVNTFDWVIQSLMEVCEHSEIQAEQCSLIVHNNGLCAVKSGTYKELEPRCSNLLERGLSAEIA